MFFKAMDLCRTSDLKFKPMDSSHFENNFKRTINCPTTRANLNEPSKRRSYWLYHWSVTLLNNGEVIMRISHWLLHNITSHSNDSASRNESKWNFKWCKP